MEMEITIRINKNSVAEWLNMDGEYTDGQIDDYCDQYADFIEEETGYAVNWDANVADYEIDGVETLPDGTTIYHFSADIDQEVHDNYVTACDKAHSFEWWTE